jgi:hypothetical protein
LDLISLTIARNMTRASRTSWKTLPPPQQREALGFAAAFNDAETELLVLGLVPKGMEDKWFIYFEGPASRQLASQGPHYRPPEAQGSASPQGWLLFHRSWTGACIYGVHLERSPGGARAVDSWVSRDPAQYIGTDVEYDRKLLRFLIDALLLRLPAVFPMPAGVESAPAGVYQHTVVGRAYPESPPDAPFMPAQSRAK